MGAGGESIATVGAALLDELLAFDALLVAGQAKSHCVAWTVADLLDEGARRDPSLVDRVYLLDDCSSPVVVPGVADFSQAAEAAYERFADAGVHRVISSDPVSSWPGPIGRYCSDEGKAREGALSSRP